MADNLTNTESYLSFRLDKEIFAVKVKSILEVLEIYKITPIPLTPEYIKGVINFRGEILPVIDMRLKLNVDCQELTPKSVIIVFEIVSMEKRYTIGAIADEVKDVVSIQINDIKPAPELGTKYNPGFLTGMIKYDNHYVMILNIEEVLSLNELTVI